MLHGQRAIDVDVHPLVPNMAALTPYMDEFWRDQVVERGINTIASQNYPPNAPKTARADWKQASKVSDLQSQLLDPYGIETAIVTPLYGTQMVFNADMARAFTRALNDWTRAEWLDRDSRLRASIVLPMHDPEHAVEEIERLAPDRRFVQAQVLVMGETPAGKRQHWQVYQACIKHGLPLAIHAGSSFRHPVTSVGWPSWYLEEYSAQAQGFQSTLGSLITEGVLSKFPELKIVLLESGVTWLMPFLYRLQKTWKGTRFEIPWVDRPPIEMVRDQVRLSCQPFDAPPEVVPRVLEMLGSDDMLMWASDWPHWQYDGEAAIPPGLPASLMPKLLRENALATYGRLRAPACVKE